MFQNNTYVNDHFVFEAACKIVQDTIKHSQAEQRKYGEKRKPSKYIFAVEINFIRKINDDSIHNEAPLTNNDVAVLQCFHNCIEIRIYSLYEVVKDSPVKKVQ